MSVKEDVLQALENNRGGDVSGEQLARELGVSRAAVWKAIKLLKEQGYPIEAATNRGYRLSGEADIVSAQSIRAFLPPKYRDMAMELFEITDSTNLQAKQRSAQGIAVPALFVAGQQTKGRGRFGRSFVSDKGCGIYMSLLLKPSREMLSDVTLVTVAAAAVVCGVIERLCGKSASIKWVNDVYINEKKGCGILTEAVTDFESGTVDSVVVGIGINYRENSAMPPEVKRIAGAVYKTDETAKISRAQIIAAVTAGVLDCWNELSKREFLPYYREKSFLLGKEIVFSKQEKIYAATAEDIDNDGELIVKLENGQIERLRSGEVSIRPKEQSQDLPFAGGGR